MNYADQEICMIDYREELVPPTIFKDSIEDPWLIARTIIKSEDKIDHNREVSMIIYLVESSYNPRLLSDKFIPQYKSNDTFSVKAVRTSTDVEVKFQELAQL